MSNVDRGEILDKQDINRIGMGNIYYAIIVLLVALILLSAVFFCIDRTSQYTVQAIYGYIIACYDQWAAWLAR